MKKKNTLFSLKDEVKIYFTSIALIISLLMLLGLFWVIIRNGIFVFWPKNIAQIVLKSEVASEAKEVLLGIIVKSSYKKNETGENTKEIKVYRANRDFLAESFKYFEMAKIEKWHYPKEIVKIERSEYGPFIGKIDALRAADGSTIQVSNTSNFNRLLKDKIRFNTKLKKKVKYLEKVKIAKINRRLEKLRLKKKVLMASKNSKEKLDKQIQKIDLEKQTLNHQYTILAEESYLLQSQQNENTLVVKAGLIKKEIALGKVRGFYYPNKMNFFQKTFYYLQAFWRFLSEEPREANTEGGIFPAIFGTFVMTFFMSIFVTPFGVITAIYLREYAREGLLLKIIRISVNNLAGVPSIVFGVFGLGFFVYFIGYYVDIVFFSDKLPTPTYGTGGVFWASLTLALLTVPVVIVATEEALIAVSKGMREGALALGATKWQMIRNILLPACTPGILTGLILAVARGAGEVAPLMIVGVVKLAPSLPIDLSFPFFHLDRKFMHLGFHIYDLGFQSPDSEVALPMVFISTLLLIVFVVCINIIAIILRDYFRKKYQIGGSAV